MKYIVNCTKIYNGCLEVEANSSDEAMEWAQEHINILDDEDNWFFGETTVDFAELDEKNYETNRSCSSNYTWEFPGGKMEQGESPEEALRREIWEELETRIVVERLIQTVEYDYPNFHLTMHCFWCHIESGALTLKEHEAARWLTKEQLGSVDWLPADRVVVETLKTE